MNIDLKPQYEGPGVKVSGKVIGVANLPAGSTPVVVLNRRTGVVNSAFAGGGSSNTLEIRIRPDGTFEFPRVPPGTYSLRTMPMVPGAGVGNQFEVGDLDMTGLTLQVPFQLQISGRMVTEGGNPPERASIMFSRGNGSMGTSIQNGTFRIGLLEGEHRVSLPQLPLGYVVKSITYDGADISQGSIRVGPETVPKELVVTLGVVPADSVPGVRVSGRVLNPAVVPYVSLISESSGVTMADVPVNPDGSFLFPKVPPGLYFLRPWAPGSRTQIVRVETQDITNLVLEGLGAATASGRLVTVDGTGRPLPPPVGVRVVFQRLNGAGSTVVRPDGSFNMTLAEGDHILILDNLPAGYSIKSMTSGTTDLGKSALQIRGTTSPPDIQITLEIVATPR